MSRGDPISSGGLVVEPDGGRDHASQHARGSASSACASSSRTTSRGSCSHERRRSMSRPVQSAARPTPGTRTRGCAGCGRICWRCRFYERADRGARRGADRSRSCQSTEYGDDLDEEIVHGRTAAVVDEALKDNMVRAYRKVLSFLDPRCARVCSRPCWVAGTSSTSRRSCAAPITMSVPTRSGPVSCRSAIFDPSRARGALPSLG